VIKLTRSYELRVEDLNGRVGLVWYTPGFQMATSAVDLVTGLPLPPPSYSTAARGGVRLTPVPPGHVDESHHQFLARPVLGISDEHSVPAAYANQGQPGIAGLVREFLWTAKWLVWASLQGPATADRVAASVGTHQAIVVTDGSGKPPRILQGDLLDVARSNGRPGSLHLFELSPADALVCQLVQYPPTTVNGGHPLLRLGHHVQGADTITWLGWLPLPGAADAETISARVTRIDVQDGHLQLCLERVSLHQRMRTQDIDYVEGWISIPIPTGMPVPSDGKLPGM